MKALVKRKEVESYECMEVLVPRPSEGELLVRVRKVALCGTDIQKYKWNEGWACVFAKVWRVQILPRAVAVAKVVAEIPFTPGHEMVGEVRIKGEMKGSCQRPSPNSLSLTFAYVDCSNRPRSFRRLRNREESLCRESFLLRPLLPVHPQ